MAATIGSEMKESSTSREMVQNIKRRQATIRR